MKRNINYPHHLGRKGIMQNAAWIVSWLVLVILGLDFFNWGKTPHLILGLPGWLWWNIGLVLLVSFVYFILTRFAWEER